MRSFTALSILAAISPVLADFSIYCGRDQNSFDGPASECLFFNNPPSCDDVGNSIQFFVDPHNDASFSGLTCDGCDAAASPYDWDITRIEVHEADYFDNGGDHWTIYKGDGDIGMYDTDMNRIGTCSIPADPQTVDCSTAISVANLKNTFNCVTAITYNSSPN